MEIAFTYFNFPFWRAEASRLALYLGDIPFKDIRPNREEFMALKASGTLPYGQLPVLDVDGIRYAQSVAIARFCGQLAGLYPTDDRLAALRVDELLDAITELNYRVYPTMLEKDQDTKLAMRQALSRDVIPQWLKHVEARLLKNQVHTYCVGTQLTVADLAMWRAVEWLSSGILDGVPTHLVDSHPSLKAHAEGIASHPKIKVWMADHYGA